MPTSQPAPPMSFYEDYRPVTTSPIHELPSPFSSNSSPSYSQRTASSGDPSPITSHTSVPSLNRQVTPQAGQCGSCYAPNIIRNTQSDSRNINSGRPYRQCTNMRCRKLNGFADQRGVNASNPLCNCQIPARLIAKKNKNYNGLQELFYTCQYKTCNNYYEDYRYEDGQVAQFNEAQIRRMAELGQI